MIKELEALQSIEATLEIGLKNRVYVKELGVTANIDKEGFLKSIHIIRAALKRNEPVKVNSFDPSNYYGGLGYFKCPKCGEEITEGYYNYCPVCGQALDWSGEK